jgi:hypothetical protein
MMVRGVQHQPSAAHALFWVARGKVANVAHFAKSISSIPRRKKSTLQTEKLHTAIPCVAYCNTTHEVVLMVDMSDREASWVPEFAGFGTLAALLPAQSPVWPQRNNTMVELIRIVNISI